jgi:hypothetical protein
MRWTSIFALLLRVLLGVALAIPAAAQSKVGIVLLHGKQSTPDRMQPMR